MKKYYLIVLLIGTMMCNWSCKKTDIPLNKAGNPADFTGTWLTANYVSKTSYLANRPNSKNDVTYRDTTVIDSTTLTFKFGLARIDSVQVIAVKKLNGVNQAPVNLPAGKWSFALGSTTGSDLTGTTYFNVYQTAYPINLVTGYGNIYTYKMTSSSSMEIRWTATSGTPQNSIDYKAVLNKQ